MFNFQTSSPLLSQPLELATNDQILAVAQGEFGVLKRTHAGRNPKMRYIHTDGLSCCSGLAMYNSKTGDYGLGHFDDGLNIPASIYMIRELFDKFFLYGDNGELDHHIVSEIKKRSGEILGQGYNGHIGNLRLDTKTGILHRAPRIDDHPRMQLIKANAIYPISLYMQGAPIVTLEPSTATMDPRENYNEHLAEVQMRTMMHPEFLKALEEGIEEDE